MTNKYFADLFDQPVRKPESDELTQFHMDVAASVQAVTEEVIMAIVRSLAAEFEIPNLCLAGGVALNCVANGKILRETLFEEIWVQPAAGDAGGALGAAFSAWHKELGNPRQVIKPDAMNGAYLGPVFQQQDIEEKLTRSGAIFKTLEDDEVLETTAQALADGKAVGWFQGRMEFGPRALGCRSILGDPRSETMQKTLNLKVKYRESFRPFAPSVLREDMADWFALDHDSPYMLLVDDVLKEKCRKLTPEQETLFGIEKLNIKRSDIPAVTHVDYSARIQTVHKETNPKYHALIERFREKTGCSVVVNTSFNVRGEPIVCTPEDAFRCFMGTEIEMLVVGNSIMLKDEQDPNLSEKYEDKYELD
jgi:carbamoyltransferase